MSVESEQIQINRLKRDHKREAIRCAWCVLAEAEAEAEGSSML
jgi:hypothetical protein